MITFFEELNTVLASFNCMDKYWKGSSLTFNVLNFYIFLIALAERKSNSGQNLKRKVSVKFSLNWDAIKKVGSRAAFFKKKLHLCGM